MLNFIFKQNMHRFRAIIFSFTGQLLLLVSSLPFAGHANPSLPGGNMDSYHKSLGQYFLSLKQDEKENDLAGKAEDLNNIGNIFFTLKDYKKALDYYHQAQETYRRLNMPDAVHSQYFPIAKVYQETGQFDSAWNCLCKATLYFRGSKGNTKDLMFAYFYSARLFNSRLEVKLAEKYYDSALTLSTRIDNTEVFLGCLLGKSELYQKAKDYRKAIEPALEGLNASRKIGDPADMMQFHELLYESYKQLNKPDLAFYNLEEYHKLNDSLEAVKLNTDFLRLSQGYEVLTEQKENEILKQQNHNYQLTQKFYITAVILGLSLILLLVIFLRQQRKMLRFKNQIIDHEKQVKAKLITTIGNEKNDKIRMISEHQEAIVLAESEKAGVQAELERKNNDLLTASTYMIRTNEKLGEISANLRTVASQLQKSSSINGELHETLEAIEKLATKDTWENFRNKFVDVHPNFFKNLNERCPGLTQNEMKLAAMIRMNLSSKDISKITMQQHNSINVARYRLRKKLKIDSEDQLIGYLLQL